MKKIGERHNGADIKLVQMSRLTVLMKDTQGWDQYGKPCEEAFVQNGGQQPIMRSCCPPLGYNIILEAPQSVDIRSAWPKSGSPVMAAPVPVTVMVMTWEEKVYAQATVELIKDSQMPPQTIGTQPYSTVPPMPTPTIRFQPPDTYQRVESSEPANMFDQLNGKV